VSKSPHPTRRRFTRALAVAAAAPLLPAPATAAEGDPQAAAALALAEIIVLRHGKDLTEGQLEHITRSILRSRRSAERLRRFPLGNDDEPAVAFSADVP
jgi:hypothetical protein